MKTTLRWHPTCLGRPTAWLQMWAWKRRRLRETPHLSLPQASTLHPCPCCRCLKEYQQVRCIYLNTCVCVCKLVCACERAVLSQASTLHPCPRCRCLKEYQQVRCIYLNTCVFACVCVYMCVCACERAVLTQASTLHPCPRCRCHQGP
jgi:hypothetical protein